jgi:ketosteroid isomerase-like protein
MSVIDRTPTSPLDHPPASFADRPFFAETVALLRAVRDHDFDTLAALCDDDFGIVDADPSGGAVPIRSRLEWERWFHGLFATLDQMNADTDSEIVRYDAIDGGDLGYSVVEFRQLLTTAGLTATFDCIATIIWKHTPQGWREARWHVSVLSNDVPEQLLAAA